MSVRRLCCGILLLTVAMGVRAAQLPIRVYTTDDGLPSNRIGRIVLDSHGFLWFCTSLGLARFDGYNFTVYGPDRGFPARFVTDVVETPAGNYWVATTTGLFRFRPTATDNPAPKPVSIADGASVSRLIVDGGVLWVGTERGLFRLEAEAPALKPPEMVDLGIAGTAHPQILTLQRDRLGSIWIGTAYGLARRWPDGRIERYTSKDGLPGVGAILEDRRGRIWIGTANGLFALTPSAQPQMDGRRAKPELIYRVPGEARTWVPVLFEDSAGRILAAMQPRVAEFLPDARPGGFPIRTYGYENGLLGEVHLALAEDVAGNLWVGGESRGAAKITRTGFTSYSRVDGLGGTRVVSLIPEHDGRFVALTAEPPVLNYWDGSRFAAAPIHLPEGLPFSWGVNQTVLHDSRGEWWVPTQRGLLRFASMPPSALARATPKAVYSDAHGLTAHNIFHLYEDRHGDIWVASTTRYQSLSRWNRRSGRFTSYSQADGLPLDRGPATAFAEDRNGSVWISGLGWLARYREGRFECVTGEPLIEKSYFRALHVDRDGRLWIAGQRGLFRIDDPGAPAVRIRVFTTAQGLSHDISYCLAEDRHGRLYVGTGKGVDRLDVGRFPGPDSVRHFSRGDGLSPGEFTDAFCDRDGKIWFGTLGGLSMLEPQPDPPRSPEPRVWIAGLRVRDTPVQIGGLGQPRIGPLVLEPSQNRVQVDFSALSFSPGEALRFQYKLDGIDRDWSLPANQRTVNYANLAPGNYHFQVRAMKDGRTSAQTAEVVFTVLRPVWQRWWFLTACALAIAAGAFALHRYTLQQALAVERLRTHIARDLHDDIGSGLSQIAILSEVAQRQPASGAIVEIASVARELVDSMGDIVWAINPEHDHLDNLVHRMRRFGEETLAASNVEMRFRAPQLNASQRTEPEVWRHLFLVFKEAVTNVARHSGAKSVDIDLELDRDRFRLSVVDDGHGFDPSNASDGNGLVNMRQRIEALRGRFDLQSAPGKGTRLTVIIALVPQRSAFSQ